MSAEESARAKLRILNSLGTRERRASVPVVSLACFLVLTRALAAAAQPPSDSIAADPLPISQLRFEHLRLIGSVDEDRLRLRQLLGDTPTDGFLVRSASILSRNDSDAEGGTSAALLEPQLRIVHNSAIPFSLNEGALWAGRGLNLELATGGMARFGPVTVIFMPTISSQRNEDFQTLPYPSYQLPARSVHASPWYLPPESLDRPSRFGRASTYSASLGQSSVTVRGGGVAGGFATENLWWGPGIRNALLMSNNAPGFPHLFIATDRPMRTALGELEGRWIVGRLSSSGYFNTESDDLDRSISALAVTFRPAFDPDLTLGVARAVYEETEAALGWTISWFDVFRNVGRPAVEAFRAPGGEPGEENAARGPDQLVSLFARWVFPESGFEAYAEWGRTEQPTNVRDLLVAPHHTQGYTVGIQWATAVGSEGALRLQTEATNLELSSTYRQRPTLSWYTSAAVPHGYTHKGRVLGAAIGPGASSQWFASDLLQPDWQAGLYLGRIRWDNGVFYRRSVNPTYLGHDVSLLTGVRGGLVIGPAAIVADLQMENRTNYLFQHIAFSQADILSVDIRNYTLRLTVGSAKGFR